MKEANTNAVSVPVKENFIAGLVGAFLFSLAGGAAWYLIYQVGFIAGISGIIGVVCAIKGYAVFAKKESVKGVIFSTIIAALVIVLAWYLCLATDVYKEFHTARGNEELSFAWCVRYAYVFLEEPEVARGYFGDLAIGMIFCIIGAFASVRNAISRVKAEKNAAAIAQAAAKAEAVTAKAEAVAATASVEIHAAEASVVEAASVEAVGTPIAETSAVEVPSVDSIEMPTVE